MTPQNKQIKDYLESWGEISVMKAFHKFYITSLHKRLSELRAEGVPVDRGTWRKTKNGKRFKVYKLKKYEKAEV